MTDDEWKYDFMFAVDLLQKRNELNVKLQGKNNFAHQLYACLKAFQSKLSLFSTQINDNNFIHFNLLSEENVPYACAQKYKEVISSLSDEFIRRFQDFKKVEHLFNILSSPFSADINVAPADIQLELIDVQADFELKDKFTSQSLSEFYSSLSAAKYPNFRIFAAKLFSIFGSTYICEQTFSCLKINKSKTRSMLTDVNLHRVLRMTTSDLQPNIKKLVSLCNELHTSHPD